MSPLRAVDSKYRQNTPISSLGAKRLQLEGLCLVNSRA
jgi:hypothetical protein